MNDYLIPILTITQTVSFLSIWFCGAAILRLLRRIEELEEK